MVKPSHTSEKTHLLSESGPSPTNGKDSNNASLYWVFVAAILVLVVATPFLANKPLDYVLWGSLVSLLCSSLTIWSYHSFRACQRHPLPLVYNKTLIDLILSIVYIIMFFIATPGTKSPVLVLGIIEGLMLSSQTWFFVMSFDLWRSITNPFTVFRKDLVFYRRCCWAVGIVSGLAFVLFLLYTPSQYQESPFLWLYADSVSWGITGFCFYDGWIVLFMSIACLALIYVKGRLTLGLAETFEVRKRVVRNGMMITTFYVLWSLFGLILSYGVSIDRSVEAGDCLLSWMYAGQGTVNALVFFVIIRTQAQSTQSSANEDEICCKPELNLALRKQVIQMAIQGISMATKYSNAHMHVIDRNPAFSLTYNSKKQRVALRSIPLARSRNGTWNEQEMHFNDFQPKAFARIRAMFGIDPTTYLDAFKTTADEHLSEGKSGAFVFFSGDQSILVKSMTKSERNFLLSILPAYLQYLLWNSKKTFLPKFYGCHSMKMYGQTFSFVTMANVFAQKQYPVERIHRRYDLKGSWVQRNAPACEEGESYKCSKCGEQFEYQPELQERTDDCSHIPDRILLDGDFHEVFDLDEDTKKGISKQLFRDSQFLAGMGITDYSLLVGIHYALPSCARDIHKRAGREEGSTHFYSLRRSLDSQVFYCFGLIDILQTWTLAKQLERQYKTRILQLDPKGISAIAPQPYAKRFQARIQQLFPS